MNEANILQRVITYIRNLTLSKTAESSKRFMALFTLLGLITYVVIRFTNTDNVVMILTILSSFVLTLAGVATWQNVREFETKKEPKD